MVKTFSLTGPKIKDWSLSEGADYRRAALI